MCILPTAVERLRKALEEEDLRKEEAQKVPTQETPPQAQEEPEDMDNGRTVPVT